MENPANYAERMKREIAFYEELLRGRSTIEVPPVWNEVEARFANQIEAVTGVRTLYEYVARHVKGRSEVTILGLGSGTCGNELDGILPLLRQQSCRMELTCIDINPTILAQGEQEARKQGVTLRGLVQDANQIELAGERYDVIVAYASLHHFLKLDHVASEANKALRNDGIFVTVDIPTRNGYRSKLHMATGETDSKLASDDQKRRPESQEH